MNTDLSRLEAALLHEAGANETLSIAYGAVRRLARPEDDDALIDLTESAMLRLFDRGLILFFRDSRQHGYGADLEGVTLLTREELVAEFEADRDPTYVPDEDDLVFFVETDAGRELFAQLPPDMRP
jgi:hypothetical protein